MFNLKHEKKIEPSNNFINPFDIRPIVKKDNRKKGCLGLSFHKLSLSSKKIHNNKLNRDIVSNPILPEMELTPNAKKYIKSILSPFAAFSYIFQESSVAFGKVIAATISFFVFSLINYISQSSIGTYEVSIPLISICLVGSILGARDLIKSIKKIILSIPNGIRTCHHNIAYENCSILDFICGIDKHKNMVKKISGKLF